jgi:tetratricopeptide (TPR) repeat protein
LLGEHSNPAAVHDDALRRAARLTLAEVCFCLAFRNVSLAPELGRPDLFGEAATAAAAAGRFGLATVLGDVASVSHAPSNEHTGRLGRLAQSFTAHVADLEPWLLLEIGARTTAWVEELEAALPAGDNALILPRILRPFYAALRLPDADSRAARLEERAIRLLVKNRRHKEALALLAQLGHPKPELEAECLEAVGEYRRAAEIFRSLGDLKRALDCYRAVPDFDAAITLIRELGAHPAAESYEWLERLRRVLAERPPNFNRAMQASEKQILQTLLEQALGVARRTPVPRRKAPAKRPARTRP